MYKRQANNRTEASRDPKGVVIMTEKVYCRDCENYNGTNCTVRKKVIKKIFHPETHMCPEWVEKIYEHYNEAWKNENNDCQDYDGR